MVALFLLSCATKEILENSKVPALTILCPVHWKFSPFVPDASFEIKNVEQSVFRLSPFS